MKVPHVCLTHCSHTEVRRDHYAVLQKDSYAERKGIIIWDVTQALKSCYFIYK